MAFPKINTPFNINLWLRLIWLHNFIAFNSSKLVPSRSIQSNIKTKEAGSVVINNEKMPNCQSFLKLLERSTNEACTKETCS